MNKTTKYISTILFGSAAWMVCAVALPMNQVADTDGLFAKVSDLVIGQAYAKDDESKSDDDKSKSDDEDKSKDEGESKSSESSSVTYDFSSDTLICVSRTSVETTLNISSESTDDGKSKDDKSSDKDDGKSSDDDKSSDKDDGKSSANESDSLMSKLFSFVIRPAYAKEDKEDDKSKSDDDKSKDGGDSKASDSSSSTVTSTDVDSLATCTALGQAGSEPGVWVPSTAVGDSAALTAYIQEVQVGGSTPSVPDSSLESYREIRGE